MSADNPFEDAEVVWHMATPTGGENYPLDLEAHGKVRFSEKLTADEHAASIKRGGDGLAAALEGGYLALNTYRARRLRPDNDEASLYVRAWVGPQGTGGIFFSDFLALVIHPSGLVIAFLGAKTPEGRVFREMPLGNVQRDQWLDLVVRIGGGHLDFACNGELISSIPIRQKLCAPFDDDLLVGAFKCSKPDLYGTAMPRPFTDCRIDTVALWHRRLSDDQVAFLSGVEQLKEPGVRDDLAQAFLDYNAFFDASVDKDVDTCSTLWRSRARTPRGGTSSIRAVPSITAGSRWRARTPRAPSII